MNLARKLIDLDRQTAKRILIAGDGMRDIYVHGHFGECQEDCPKFVEDFRVEVPGGACNAERSLENWNAAKNIICFCHTNPIKTRFIVNGEYVFRHDDEGPRPKPMTLDLVEMDYYDAVLISDYDKGFLTPEIIQTIIRAANERKNPVVVDAKREPSIYVGAIIKCNEEYYQKYKIELAKHKTVIVTRGEKLPVVF